MADNQETTKTEQLIAKIPSKPDEIIQLLRYSDDIKMIESNR
jgi:hypothetical protein